MQRLAAINATIDTWPISKSSPVPLYSYVSTYRSLNFDLRLYSSSVKVLEDGRAPMAVFTDHDQIAGRVTLDPSCYPAGRLTIFIEGALLCPSSDGDVSDPSPRDALKQVFLSLESTIKVSNLEEKSPTYPKQRPGVITSNASNLRKSYPFSFDLPQGMRPGEEMPSAFTPTKGSDTYEVTYNIILQWRPSNSRELPSDLVVPFLLQPDADLQCVDPSSTTTWIEIPLKSDRLLQLRGAITLPSSMAFSRSSSVPYFVVFTTTPRSPALAKEVATDATISVSLIRQVVISEQSSILPTTRPSTPSSDSESTRSRSSKHLGFISKSKLKLAMMSPRDKPLPTLPVQKIFSNVQTIHKDICIGFPKRPRQHLCHAQSHPSLKEMAALPDGLHKTRIQLNADMLPSIDWGGITVKYYLDVSVSLGPDDLRARIPIRIF